MGKYEEFQCAFTLWWEALQSREYYRAWNRVEDLEQLYQENPEITELPDLSLFERFTNHFIKYDSALLDLSSAIVLRTLLPDEFREKLDIERAQSRRPKASIIYTDVDLWEFTRDTLRKRYGLSTP